MYDLVSVMLCSRVYISNMPKQQRSVEIWCEIYPCDWFDNDVIIFFIQSSSACSTVAVILWLFQNRQLYVSSLCGQRKTSSSDCVWCNVVLWSLLLLKSLILCAVLVSTQWKLKGEHLFTVPLLSKSCRHAKRNSLLTVIASISCMLQMFYDKHQSRYWH